MKRIKYREHLPKIQMYQDLATPFLGLCEKSNSFLLSENGYACDPSFASLTPYPELSLSDEQLKERLSIQSFDHLLTESDASPVILYSSYLDDISEWIQVLKTHPSVAIRPFHSHSLHPQSSTRLGGYGIALDIKNTEYKVLDDRTSEGSLSEKDEKESSMEVEIEGFNFGVLKERSSDSSLKELQNSFPSGESVAAESITPEQMKDIGIKTTQWVHTQSNPMSQLAEILMNFPKVAGSIAQVPIEESLRKEAEQINMMYGHATGRVFLNNQQINLNNNYFNLFSLLTLINHSFTFAETIKSYNLTNTDIATIASILKESTMSDVSIRLSLAIQKDPSILWMNNIEKDPEFKQFSTNLNRFFMAAYSFPRVRANFVNSVYVIDPLNSESMEVYQTMYEMMQQGWPIRQGFLFTSSTLRELVLEKEYQVGSIERQKPVDPVQLLELVYALFEEHSPMAVIVFMNNLLGEGKLTVDDAINWYYKLTDSDTAMDVLKEGKYISKITSMVRFVHSIGLEEGVQMINGQVQEIMPFNAFIHRTFQEIALITEGIGTEQIKSVKDILPYIMKQSTIANQYDLKIYASFEEQDFVQINQEMFSDAMITVQQGSAGHCIVSIPSIIALPDLVTLLSSLSQMKDLTVSITSPDEKLVPILLLVNQASKKDLLPSMNEILLCVNKGMQLKECMELYMEEEELQLLDPQWEENEQMKGWNHAMASFFEGREHSAIILNGRIIEPLSFSENTILSLITMDKQLTEPLAAAFPSISPAILLPFIHSHYKQLNVELPKLPYESPFVIKSDKPSAIACFTAILDPLSLLAQRTVAILNEIQQYVPISYHILLIPQTDYSELPLKRFYRYVLNADQKAVWRNLPQHYIYTMTTEVPYKWNVVAYYAEADLDNLRISNDNTYILAQYVVDGVIVEGSAYKGNDPASGVMLQLNKQAENTVVSDTIVMNNHGYWQLRGDMGLYEISVSDESPEDVLISEGKPIAKKSVYLWSNMDETVSLTIGKKEKEAVGMFERMKSSFFSKSTLNKMAESEEEYFK